VEHYKDIRYGYTARKINIPDSTHEKLCASLNDDIQKLWQLTVGIIRVGLSCITTDLG